MGKYLDNNWKDLDRLLKLVIIQLMSLTPLSLYYRTELLMSTNLISNELTQRNKILSSNFKLSSDLVGNVADKFIILLLIICILIVFNSIYSALTFDSFIISGWFTVINIVFGISAAIFPISNNQINYESETAALVCFIILLAALIPFLLFRLFGYLITFVFFNSKIHDNKEEFDEEECINDELDSEYNDNIADIEEDKESVENVYTKEELFDDNSSTNTKRKSNKKKKTSFYEDSNSSTLDLNKSNRVSIFKR